MNHRLALFMLRFRSSWLRLLTCRTFSSQHNWDYLIPADVAHVGGNWARASSGKSFSVTNPANGDLIRNIPDMSASEVETSIKCAKATQEAWAHRPANDRADVIRRWADALRKNRHTLAQLITAENGKILSDAQNEVMTGIMALEWYAEEAKRTYGYYVPPLHVTNREQLVYHQPVGVVGVITPWNFPLSMVTRKVGAALAAGCSVVLKPPEDTPLSALAITHLAIAEANLPTGVLNTITAGRSNAEIIGNILCTHPDVRLIGFTGSTAVGKHLYTQAAAHGKRVLLELGGNAPFIVFSSANLDKAVEGAIVSKFRCSGQTCVSANRIFVEAPIYHTFVDKLAAAVANLRLGNGAVEGVTVGPLINKAAVEKVSNLVESAKQAGAKATSLPMGENLHPQGCFYPPTVLADCSPQMECCEQEIFGPVAPIIRFHSELEAISLANSTNYGLAAYLYSENSRQIWHVSKQLKFGMIGVNSPRVSTIELPFGGVKESGVGREGGPHSLSEFLDVKTICWDLEID